MAENTEQVKREIEETRAELGETIDAIQEKVNPRQAVRRRVERVQDVAGDLRDRVMGVAESASENMTDRAVRMGDSVSEGASSVATTVKEAPQRLQERAQGNPMAAGVVALGLGMLIGSLLPPTRAEEEVAPKLREKVVEPAKEAATEVMKEAGQAMKGDVQEAAEQVKETAMEGADQVRERAKETASTVKDDMAESSEEVGQRPLESREF